MSIFFEDDDFLILNKPHGLPCVPHLVDQKPHPSVTAVSLALQAAPALQGVGPDPLEPGLLHRLDTTTSGLLLFAKNDTLFQHLKKHWKNPQHVSKFYRAIVTPSPKQHSAERVGARPADLETDLHADLPHRRSPFDRLPLTLRQPMGHDKKSKKKMRVLDQPHTKSHTSTHSSTEPHPISAYRLRQIRGKLLHAVTHILAAKRLPPLDPLTLALSSSQLPPAPSISSPTSPATSPSSLALVLSTLWELEIQIETGVMHQIRAHLSNLGFPILGDLRYQGAPAPRTFLHAWKLKLDLPPLEQASGSEHPSKRGALARIQREWIAPLPDDWITAHQK